MSVIKKVVAFVDGENLVLAYQSMCKAGRRPKPGISHEQDCFVWHDSMTLWTLMDLIRVSYYTSVVGDDDRVNAVATRISSTVFSCSGAHLSHITGQAKIIPRVHKKPKQSHKTKVVDVDITMDVMRAALTMPVDGIFLLSGDGDYIPLVREVVRATNKQVYIGAFSNGLAQPLRNCAEQFVDLDPMFFE